MRVVDIADWERAGSRLDVAGESVFVVDHPAVGPERGAPVLVLHGFPTCSFDWVPVLDALTRGRRAVLCDFPGYGLSDKPDRPYSLFGQADVVETVAREVGVDSVVLVSHDMGDSVAGELLARDLDGTLGFGVERRVLTNGSIYLGMAQLTDGQKILRALPDARLPEGGGADGAALATALRGTLAPDSSVADAELATLGELIVREDGHRLLPRLIRYLDERAEHEGRWTGAIERHPAPLTIVWGDLDPIAVWPMAERLHAAVPDATLVRLEGVGHYLMLEAPAAVGAALTHALA